MPELGLRLTIGEVDADSIVGPPIGGGPPPPDGVIQSEAGDLLLVEAGQFLAFD
jgi:hypothetical protein